MINLDILTPVKKASPIILFAHVVTLSLGLSAWTNIAMASSVSEKTETVATPAISRGEKSDTKNKKNPTATGSTLTDLSDNKKEKESSETSDTESGSTNSEKRIKQEINTYIIESYKAQWNKIIKDLSAKLTISIPEEKDRKIAYEKIRASLSMRIEQTQEDETISETKREILIEFLKHLIGLLNKKISELE
jgi:hypothetical protein